MRYYAMLAILLFTANYSSASDDHLLEEVFGSYAIGVPVVQDRTYLSGAVAGQLVYDNGSGAFFGLPVGGDPVAAGGWVQLSEVAGTNAVTSGGLERVERARIASCTTNGACTISSKSSDWLVFTRTGTGVYTMTFAANIFSEAPTCVAVCGNRRFLDIGTSSATSGYLDIYNSATEAFDDCGGHINLICMGPR